MSDEIISMETIGQRLARLRKAKGLSQAELARQVGLSGQGAIGNIERDSRGYGASIVEIAKVLGTTPEYLQLNQAAPVAASAKEIDLENNPDFPSIRRVKFKLSAGASGFAVEYRGELGPPLTFAKEWYEKHGYKPDDLFATQVANGSMEPGLYDGDTVVVNTAQTEPKDGRVFAVNYEGELVIKRLIRDDGEWWLSSDNPDQRRYPRKRCHEGVHMVGQIIHKQSERL